MACALEVRSPFLDYRLVEFSARIPSSMKIKGRTQKAILKRAFEQQLPKEILEREKSGFTVPLSSWLRRELHDFARSALLSPSSAIAGVVSREQIALMLDQHVQLWRLLVLENWLQATSVHSWATSASA
jgi:asparagine synthase (glutamine-hydrolysing)